MDQQSSLRVGVDSQDADRSIKRTTSGLDTMGNQALKTERQFYNLTLGIDHFGDILRFASLGLLTTTFSDIIDSATRVDNSLKLVTNTTGELNAVYQELYDISNKTRTPLADNAELFRRLSIATDRMGLSYQDQLNLTEQLNQAMIISGTATSEAIAGLRQLGQALGTNTLKQDEFVSVNENLPRVMKAIADSLGVTRGELKKLASEGKLTTKVIVDAMAEAAPQLAEEFAKVAPTIENAFTVLQNHMLNFARETNRTTGLNTILAQGILLLADNFEVLAGAVVAISTVIAGRLAVAFATMAVGFAATPIGAFTVALGTLGLALGAFGDEMVSVGGETVTVWQGIRAAVATASQNIGASLDQVKTWYGEVRDAAVTWVTENEAMLAKWGVSLSTALEFVQNLFKTSANTIIAVWVTAYDVIVKVWEQLPDVFRGIQAAAANAVIDGAETATNGVVNLVADTFRKLEDIVPHVEGTGDAIEKALSVSFERLNVDEKAKKAFGGLGAAISDAWEKNLNTDFLDGFGKTVEGTVGVLKTQYLANLKDVIATDKEAAANAELLNNKYSSLAGSAGGAGNAIKGASRFIDQVVKAYAKLQEEQGNATVGVEAWYAQQTLQLTKLGLEHSKYADMVQAIYKDKLMTARTQDIQSANAWSAGLTRAQKTAIEDMAESFEELQAARGGAEAQVEKWHTTEVEILSAVGLATTQFADQLEDVYTNRIQQARVDDIKNTQEWAKGLTQVQKDVVGSIREEWLRVTESQDANVQETYRWYEEQKKILIAAGLVYEDFATQLDELFKKRLKDARDADLENATDWRSGIERAVAGLAETYKSEADVTEGAFNSVFDNMASAIVDFAETGKLNFKDFARSVASDILMLTTKFLLLKAVQSSMQSSGGGMWGSLISAAGSFFGNSGSVAAATGGYIQGPGTGTSDSIAARLSNGEYVVNAEQTARYRDILDAINAGNLNMYAEGGYVTPVAQPVVPLSSDSTLKGGKAAFNTQQEVKPAQVKVVNVLDPREALSALNTAEGEQLIMNTIERNPYVVRKLLGVS